VVRSKGVGSGVTGSVRATLRKDGVEHDAHIQQFDEVKAIKSPGAGTTEIDFRDTFRNNVAAYRIARLIGLDQVAVTVERTHERKNSLIYNYDRNLGNLLIDKSWNVWMIDHGRAFKIFKELKDPGNLGTHCPRAMLAGMPQARTSTANVRANGSAHRR